MSSELAISVNNIGKLYRLGQVGTGTLSHDLKRWWYRARGLEDPYMKVGVENDRTKKDDSLYSWALQDISFQIEQGDTVGIIGKNGAGKSTLLKILSRVTSPSTGSIKVKGRIASLLEVGTGFHPELTGRENIFMNGAILGMTKKEIAGKFDEIVDFAGIERYIDTPVKRYSSGMYVRLAFAVAAHLEPEILIVDEVLAVGDAEFQKKCLGKMGDVASHGRTIIFVSHNMQAVQSLCKSALYLKAGRVATLGSTHTVVNDYMSKEVKNCLKREWDRESGPGNEFIQLLSAEIIPVLENDTDAITVATALDISFNFINFAEGMATNLSLLLYNAAGYCIFNVGTDYIKLAAGKHQSTLSIPRNLLNDDIYTVTLLFVKDTTTVVFSYVELLTFEVFDEPRQGKWFGKWEGAVRPKLDFSLT